MADDNQQHGDILDRLTGPQKNHYSAAEEVEESTEKKKWKRRGAVIFAVIALLLLIKGSCRQSEKAGAVKEKANIVVHSAEVLGMHIAREFPGAKILLISEPKWSADYREELIRATVSGLEWGLDGKGHVSAVDAPELSQTLREQNGQGDVKATWAPPVDCWFSAEALDIVLWSHADCTLAVSMIGLPSDFAETYLTPGARPPSMKLAVLSGPLPPAGTTALSYEKDILIGAVVDHPLQTGDPRPVDLPPELKDAFSSRHVLLTRENILYYAKKRQNVFGVQ